MKAIAKFYRIGLPVHTITDAFGTPIYKWCTFWRYRKETEVFEFRKGPILIKAKLQVYEVPRTDKKFSSDTFIFMVAQSVELAIG